MTRAEELRFRYPAFAPQRDDVLDYWLADAARIVTAGWGEDEGPALLALAAHNMALGGIGAADDGIPAGVTSFRSGTFAVTLTDAAAAQSAKGGYESTRYGRDFLPMLRRNSGGPFLAGFPWC